MVHTDNLNVGMLVQGIQQKRDHSADQFVDVGNSLGLEVARKIFGIGHREAACDWAENCKVRRRLSSSGIQT